MAAERPPVIASATTNATSVLQEKRYRSIFDVPANFLDACRLLSSSAGLVSETSEKYENPTIIGTLEETDDREEKSSRNGAAMLRWTCNICKAEFESLQEQRSHFKSDIHRINVKLSIAGKDIVNEEDLDDLTSDSFRDYDISSISGSEDENEKGSFPLDDIQKGSNESTKRKLFMRLHTGERVSLWKCMVLNEFESVSYENEKEVSFDCGGYMRCLKESEVIERLNFLIHEPRDKTCLRILLLASGGHFAGCVFDGNAVVVHKTFHRYVVRAKAGKKQSSKDASGRAAHSAGASLRRHNELALKKDVQELLSSWKPYFDASTCVFIYAPSSNRHLFFDGDKAYFSDQHCFIRNVPLNVRRPTFKEAQRIYNQLTQVAYEVDEKDFPSVAKEDFVSIETSTPDGSLDSRKEDLKDCTNCGETTEASSRLKDSDDLFISTETESAVIGVATPLHKAAHAGDANKVLELLEQGLDPCVKDERGRTPYMLATEKEVRNNFRRFMASNLDRWDWHAAKVPSALTKEMEESQAEKQAEKDAKRKARAKELKKLRKAKEKAQAATSQNSMAAVENQVRPRSAIKGPLTIGGSQLSEEELKRAQAAEREKRAAAAESRMAAAQNAQGSGTATVANMEQPKSGLATDINCSCCNASLAGKVPFHRYNYKYCSTTCMHVHREFIEDG
ncbi:hypothetical protein P3X46_003787 [Hevea brasiliensis]|uniref:VLRF1 domain-containing protein n=2 Tax=Magnoliopsida TaxID=3398 RepID=A0ABQ9N9I4_HEVBR|nr:uncharacterized protein LOC110673915 [Hevea brasiliensis]KAJ9188428.1 hypothetical protein P3X46_003787 [Hevea brasiliensis]